jgi:ATP-dependent Clp protease ATP-binding subunit ClpA
MGFERGPARDGDDEEAINRAFSPEFRNRLDAIIPFRGLSPETIGRVVDKFIMQLEAQLGDRGVTIELTDDARTWIGRKGYDPAMGARPLSRVIQEHVKKPLADELLFGKLVKGGAVKIDAKDNRLTFDYPPQKPAPKAMEHETVK